MNSPSAVTARYGIWSVVVAVGLSYAPGKQASCAQLRHRAAALSKVRSGLWWWWGTVVLQSHLGLGCQRITNINAKTKTKTKTTLLEYAGTGAQPAQDHAFIPSTRCCYSLTGHKSREDNRAWADGLPAAIQPRDLTAMFDIGGMRHVA